MGGRYYEDFVVGEEWKTDGVTLTESEIIDFALKYDPQPFHIDAEAAKATLFGGIVASAWHVHAVAFRMMLQSRFLGDASMGSPGADETRYLKPVRPGDTVHTVMKVLDKRESTSRDDRGYVTVLYEIRNQHDEIVTTMRGNQIIGRRPK